MNQPISDLNILLSTLKPRLLEEQFVYATTKGALPSELNWLALFKEDEGLTIITTKLEADRYGLQSIFQCACISLCVTSDLSSVGLTAAVSSTLAKAGISCNVQAAYYHDHLFVPYNQKDLALQVLNELSQTPDK